MSAEAVRYVLAQNIKPVALKFYMERVAYRIDNNKGYAWPSQETIAQEMSVSRTTVRKYQEEAERRGILVPTNPGHGEKGRFRSNHYGIPGFVEWLKQTDDDARTYFVRAISETPCKPGVTTDAVATRSYHGPWQPGGATKRKGKR